MCVDGIAQYNHAQAMAVETQKIKLSYAAKTHAIEMVIDEFGCRSWCIVSDARFTCVLQFYEREATHIQKRIDASWGLEALSLQEQRESVNERVDRIMPPAMLPRLLMFAEEFQAHAYQQALIERLSCPDMMANLAIHPVWSSPAIHDNTVSHLTPRASPRLLAAHSLPFRIFRGVVADCLFSRVAAVCSWR